ncbi:MAG TPA: asparagine synthase (glutamine-hydrolyzing) [Thermodesulfobacteriota bacterium]
MCGICGKVYFDHSRPVEREVISSMNDVLRHRGPDDEGIYINGNVGLGMRRLSIIDIEGGKQPIKNEDGTVRVVYNGEIYNFPELKDTLMKRGHKFYTRSDTEVIVHLYEDLGEDFVKELNGMFGIALWDDSKKKLILARDSIGIKPLFYAVLSDRLIFGSEIKSILKDRVPRNVDLEALHDYLSLNYVPAPYTMFKGIRKLEPGNMLIFQNGRVSNKKYWDVQYFTSDSQPSSSGLNNEETYTERLLEILKDSVKRHLISDVPLGVFLSGGMDSSTIVALMSQMNTRKIKTFTIGFEEKSYNEVDDARLISRRFDTEHYELIVRPNIVDLLPKLIRSFDEPYADSSAIPTYYVSKLAREHVKVCLGGDGGDEIFAGYVTYPAYKVANLYKKLPGILTEKFIPYLVNSIPVSDGKVSFDYKAKRFVEGALLPPAQGHFWWKVIFTEEMKQRLYSEELKSTLNGFRDSFQIFNRHFDECTDSDTLQKLLYVDLKVYLPDDILVKVDRMSMAHSLEARVPFLDREVVEFMAGVPSRLKMKRLSTKYVLKKALNKLLPQEILKKKKGGFNVPIPRWIKNDLKDRVIDALSPSKIRSTGFFNETNVSQILNMHIDGKKDYSRNIWGLFMFMLWHDEYISPH